MSDKDILTHLEVTLSGDVLHDVATSGKVFKSQLFCAEKATSGLQSCILLDKISDNLVKLLVTVYNAPDVWVRRAETVDNGTQTDTTCTQAQSVQVGTEMCVADCQASVTNSTVDSQTEVNAATCSSQTSVSMALQEDCGVQATTDMAIGDSQTTVSMALETEQGVQATVELSAVDMQTNVSMAWQSDQMSQATAQCSEQPSQTAISIALQAEQGVQAVTGTAAGGSQTMMSMALQSEQEVQAVTMTTACDSQTAMSMALQGEQGVQTVIKMSTDESQTAMSMALQAEQSTQAIAETNFGDSQTIVSMALQREQGMQAVMETVVSDSQTDMSMALKSEQEVQAATETATVDSQTVNTLNDDSQLNMSSSQLSTATDSQSDAAPNSQPSSTAESKHQPDIPTDFGFVPPPLLDGPHRPIDARDGEAQTDPVTIIIGDASFLVEQLKGSASSPGKVNTSGNHIEIEVRNDINTPATHNKENIASLVRRNMDYDLFHQQTRVESEVGDGGKYSCPFCTMTFHESPGLYDHLQNSHNEKCKSVKKARGRDGKTIIYHEPSASGGQLLNELEPPVLLPILPWQAQSDGTEINQKTEDGKMVAAIPAAQMAAVVPALPPALSTAPPVASPTASVLVTPVTAADEQPPVDAVQDSQQQYCCPLCPQTFAATSGLEVHWAAVHKAALSGAKAVRQMRPRTAAGPTEDAIISDVNTQIKRKRSSAGAPVKRVKQEDELSPNRVTRSSDHSAVTTRSLKIPPKLERQPRVVMRKK